MFDWSRVMKDNHTIARRWDGMSLSVLGKGGSEGEGVNYD
jgi:hypothetical protein